MAIKKEELYFFIQKPRFAVVISLFIVIVGVISLLGLQQEKYPNITPPNVTVSASYPGASATVIESSVASLLESQLNGVQDMIICPLPVMIRHILLIFILKQGQIMTSI